MRLVGILFVSLVVGTDLVCFSNATLDGVAEAGGEEGGELETSNQARRRLDVRPSIEISSDAASSFISDPEDASDSLGFLLDDDISMYLNRVGSLTIEAIEGGDMTFKNGSQVVWNSESCLYLDTPDGNIYLEDDVTISRDVTASSFPTIAPTPYPTSSTTAPTPAEYTACHPGEMGSITFTSGYGVVPERAAGDTDEESLSERRSRHGNVVSSRSASVKGPALTFDIEDTLMHGGQIEATGTVTIGAGTVDVMDGGMIMGDMVMIDATNLIVEEGGTITGGTVMIMAENITDMSGSITGSCGSVNNNGAITDLDTDPTNIVCPDSVVGFVDEGETETAVTFEVTATDNCSNEPDITVVTDHASGSNFGLGTNPVMANATDAAGNYASCTFDVIVAICSENSTFTPCKKEGEALHCWDKGWIRHEKCASYTAPSFWTRIGFVCGRCGS